jgi:hypothetical protein
MEVNASFLDHVEIVNPVTSSEPRPSKANTDIDRNKVEK